MNTSKFSLLQLFAEGGEGEAPTQVTAPEGEEPAPGEAQQPSGEDTTLTQPERYARHRVELWHRQAAQAREVYPDLDLAREVRNPGFLQLLRRGLDVESAYTLIHRDQILTSAMRHAARVARQQLSSAIQSGATRPAENGIQTGTAVSVQDVAHLTRSQRNDIRKRAARGERIRL
jgi:hypothetical protein